jgi:DUF4097 and DUF4098 domain-containing protein YvlB
MTTLQKVIKYLALAFAIFLTVSIVGGILSAVGLLGSLFSDDDAEWGDVIGETKNYTVSSEISDLNIQINAADFYIKEGNSFSVESNLKNLEVDEKNGCLTLKDLTKIKLNGSNAYENAVLTIWVPVGTVFDNVNIKTGAGRFTVDSLSAATIGFELGAGDVTISKLIAEKSANIEGGAGRITISDGAIKNLDLEMGLGQLNLTSALTGDCNLDSGVGEMNVTLLGSKDDYELDIEKGIGNITVDGKNVTDFGSSGNGANEVDIHGGVGAINVRFNNE